MDLLLFFFLSPYLILHFHGHALNPDIIVMSHLNAFFLDESLSFLSRNLLNQATVLRIS